MDGEHIVAACILKSNNKSIQTYALIDTGCSGFAFIDKDFARHHQFPLIPLSSPRNLHVIDGRPISSGKVTHRCHLPLSIDSHHEAAPFFVTKLGSYPLVLGIPWLKLHDPMLRFKDNTISFSSNYCRSNCNASQTYSLIKGLTSANIKTTLVSPQTSENTKLQVYNLTEQNNEYFNQKLPSQDWRVRVPEQYHRYYKLMDESFANSLPPRRSYDHKIILKEGKEPPFGPLYGMSKDELATLKEYIRENIQKGFIRASSSPAGAPVLFVKKADGTLRLCVDYRGLNGITVKNRYPLPLIKETLDQLYKAKWYTKLDLRQGYNQIRIAEGEEWKTAFRTRYGHFEYTVMPFGLTNAPATFQHFINDCLRDYLDVFCTAYLDDILIYSNSLKEHQTHVSKVLQALQDSGVLLKPEKCEFHTQSTKYLGLIIEPGGIKMDPKKVDAVRNWKSPKTLKDVQAFLGFANFYRRFIRGFSALAFPLYKLTRKNTPFSWDTQAEKAFESLKISFTSAPILAHFDPQKRIVVETDASDYVAAGILSQYDPDGLLRPVAYFSKKHSPAECNYEIYDKELLAIIRAFEEWRPELEGATHPISVISDHKNLEYFMSTKQLNRRQARWAEYLSRFNFIIKYRAGNKGGKPDALTRRSEDMPDEKDARRLHQSQTILKKENLECIKLSASSFRDKSAKFSSLEKLFKEGYQNDKFPHKILSLIKNKAQHSNEISLAECTELEGKLYYREKIFVPNYDPLKIKILTLHHNDPSAGHPGREKTFELISRDYYWPSMRKYVAQYVRNCHTCQRSKPANHAKFGVLRPLPIALQPWQEVSMDFVTQLPESEGFDAILVVVDRLTKLRHLIPCTTTTTSEDVARLYLRNVWKLHGLPKYITTDRGTQFTAKFWRQLCKHLGIEARMSTAFHPETDGQTERFNAVMEQYLRSYVKYQQDDWVHWLPMAEFAANNHVSATTRATPFFSTYGFHPNFTISLKPYVKTVANINAVDFANKMKSLHDYLRSNIRTAQDQQEQAVNSNRKTAPCYQIGDQVFLSAKHIKTSRNCKKLDWKKLGPYSISKVVSPYAYKLNLPKKMKIHPVFHVSLLEPAANDPVPGQTQPPPPPVIINDVEEYSVEEIYDSRISSRKGLQYLVKWTGYDDPTWEPAVNLEDTAASKIFHRCHPTKPKP